MLPHVRAMAAIQEDAVKPLALLAAAALLAGCDSPTRPDPLAPRSDPSLAVGQAAGSYSTSDYVARVDRIAAMVGDLETSGRISHGQAQSLTAKLDRARRALAGAGKAHETAGGIAAAAAPQQSFLAQIGQAIRALLDFVRELSRLVTDLPRTVVQPIIDATIGLLSDLVRALLG
jgi:hypothetical protein